MAVPPEIVRRIVTEYSDEHALVVDPFTASGSTLVQAALFGRRAIGVVATDGAAAIVRAHLDQAIRSSRRAAGEIRVGDARRLAQVMGDLTGAVDLIVMAPQEGCDAERPLRRRETRAVLADVAAGCRSVLRPGGRLVVVTKHEHRAGRVVDVAGMTAAAATGAGFTYLNHVIALDATIRDGELVARPSRTETARVRRQRARGEPVHLVAHVDIGVFVKGAGVPDAG